MSRYLSEVRAFLEECRPLPVEPGKIAAQLLRAGSLFQRAIKEGEPGKPIPHEVNELAQLQGELETLNRQATRREKSEIEKRRRFTQSETFRIDSIEASIKELKSRLKDLSKGSPTRARLEQLIKINRDELQNIVEGRVSVRNRAQTRAEFIMQHAKLRARLRLAKDEATREILTQELRAVESEIERIDNAK